MKHVEIPDELVSTLERIQYLNHVRTGNQDSVVDQKRHNLLEALRALPSNTIAEKALIDEIALAEETFKAAYNKTENETWKELCGLYEKVRQCCKDMFLGKYVYFSFQDGVGHNLHVRGVKIYQIGDGHLCIYGTELQYNVDGTIAERTGIEYKLFRCGEILGMGLLDGRIVRSRLESALDKFMYIDLDAILDMVETRKKEIIKVYDLLATIAKQMPDEDLFPDNPANAEEWW